MVITFSYIVIIKAKTCLVLFFHFGKLGPFLCVNVLNFCEMAQAAIGIHRNSAADVLVECGSYSSWVDWKRCYSMCLVHLSGMEDIPGRGYKEVRSIMFSPVIHLAFVTHLVSGLFCLYFKISLGRDKNKWGK